MRGRMLALERISNTHHKCQRLASRVEFRSKLKEDAISWEGPMENRGNSGKP